MPAQPGPPSLPRKLGARIRALRLEADITQEQLAWDCDLSKPYLSQVEAGKRLPSLRTLSALADRLDIEIVDLLALDLDHPRLKLLDAARRLDRKGVRQALRELGLG